MLRRVARSWFPKYSRTFCTESRMKTDRSFVPMAYSEVLTEKRWWDSKTWKTAKAVVCLSIVEGAILGAGIAIAGPCIWAEDKLRKTRQLEESYGEKESLEVKQHQKKEQQVDVQQVVVQQQKEQKAFLPKQTTMPKEEKHNKGMKMPEDEKHKDINMPKKDKYKDVSMDVVLLRALLKALITD